MSSTIMSDKPTFETTDIRLGSWLIARGFTYLGYNDGTGKLRFRFSCTPEQAGLYHGPDDTVSARRLFAAWRQLRDDVDSYHSTNRSVRDAYRPARQDR